MRIDVFGYFNTLIIEATYGSSSLINDDIHYGRGDLSDILMKINGSGVWNNNEFSRVLDWLRNYNQSRHPDRKISVYGVDIKGNSLGMASVLSYLHKVHPNKKDAIKVIFNEFSIEEKYWLSIALGQRDESQLKKLEPEIENILTLFIDNKEKFVKSTSKDE